METLSCHSNQSSYPPGIKNTNYVEATVRKCIQSIGLIPLTVSEKIFESFSKFCPIWGPATNQNKGLGQKSQHKT